MKQIEGKYWVDLRDVTKILGLKNDRSALNLVKSMNHLFTTMEYNCVVHVLFDDLVNYVRQKISKSERIYEEAKQVSKQKKTRLTQNLRKLDRLSTLYRKSVLQ